MPVLPDPHAVCVIIAARDAEATIARAVRSALTQAHVAEVVVVDDASADRTAAAAEAADDGTGRLAIHRLPRNLGPAGARNLAIERSRSPYLCVLDADDYVLPGRTARMMHMAPDGWDLLADDLIIVPQEMECAGFSLICDEEPGTGTLIDVATFVRCNISRPGRPRAELGFLKPIMSRAFLDRNGLRYEPTMRLGEDYALYTRALLAGARFRLISACGYIAVERSDSISARHRAADLEQMSAFDARCLTHPALSAGERRALRAHRAATLKKVALGKSIEVRRAQGLGPALLMLARRPAALPYVAIETARAKARLLRARVRPGASPEPSRKLRFLIGSPGARLSAPA